MTRHKLAALVLTGLAAAVSMGSHSAASAQPSEEFGLSVEVERHRLGPLRVSVTQPRNGGDDPSDAWMFHDLTITNATDTKIDLADTRTAAYDGGENGAQIAFADEGCFPWPHPDDPETLTVVCQEYLDELEIPPGESITRRIRVYRDLGPMQPLTVGTYRFARPLRFERPRPKVRPRAIRLAYSVSPGR